MSKSWSKDMKLDPFTFGKSKACEVLADMMNQGAIPVIEKHRVLSFITDLSRDLKDISSIKNKRLISKVGQLYRKDCMTKVENMPYGIKFKSYLRNVVSYIYRKHLEEV